MSNHLAALPAVHRVLASREVADAGARYGAAATRQAARDLLAAARARVAQGEPVPSLEAIASEVRALLERRAAVAYPEVLNATGVLIHTNLGRSPQLTVPNPGYVALEYDLASGERGERLAPVTARLARYFGAAAATVVTNNAAALVLLLAAHAAGREVIVSRGEMVEIGGAFRIPEILKLAGCRLVEVGCTNRTHLRDYERAITAETALILSVHQSNYRIVGFAEQTPVAELAELAHARKIACAHDLGSGALLDLRAYGLPHEPTVPESLAAGADVTLFSGDKLLGGPQCGIILGKKAPLAAMHKNPFYRAFRVGKLTLAALEATLRLFLEPETLLEKHRLMSLLTAPLEGIRLRAESLAQEIAASCAGWLAAEAQSGESEIGGGSLAGYPIPTVVVQLRPQGISPDDLAARLRQADPPIFTRIREGCVVLDLRTMLAGEEKFVVPALKRIST
jgi:L-seryl-tRNA(Ser) seleniumtransferase